MWRARSVNAVRLSFMVGVTIPLASLRSARSSTNLRTCSERASFALAALTAAPMVLRRRASSIWTAPPSSGIRFHFGWASFGCYG